MTEFVEDNVVINPKEVMESASGVDFDQVVVIGKKDGKRAIWSSHSADEMEELIDDALEDLYAGLLEDFD